MSSNFVINVKVIVMVVSSILMVAITIMLSSYVESEKKFKEDVVDELKDIKEAVGATQTTIKIHEMKIEGVEKRIQSSTTSINNIKYTLYKRGIPIIKDADTD